MTQIIRSLGLILLLLNVTPVFATFYTAGTLAEYCKEHLKFVALGTSHNRLSAGICQGYLASKIEVMTLTQQLCQRESLNLDRLAADFVAYVDEDPQRASASATRGVIEVLQAKHACAE
tara:strand:- start:19795 stop:20151 length:357 start_codon:yes stop_codon:yes gene_type:complete